MIVFVYLALFPSFSPLFSTSLIDPPLPSLLLSYIFGVHPHGILPFGSMIALSNETPEGFHVGWERKKEYVYKKN